MVELPLELIFQGVVVTLLELVESLVHLLREEDAAHEHSQLRAVLEQPLVTRQLVVARNGLLELHRQRLSHRVNHRLQPELHGAVARAVFAEFDVLVFGGEHAQCCLQRLTLVVELEFQLRHGGGDLGHVPLNARWVRSLTEDVEQVGIRNLYYLVCQVVSDCLFWCVLVVRGRLTK